METIEKDRRSLHNWSVPKEKPKRVHACTHTDTRAHTLQRKKESKHVRRKPPHLSTQTRPQRDKNCEFGKLFSTARVVFFGDDLAEEMLQVY